MSKLVKIEELNSEEQDFLWINNKCPFCGSIIHNRDLKVEIPYWICYRCDSQFIVE